MQKTNQQQVWNKIALSWSKFRQKPIPEVIDFLKGRKGKLLDMGCGSGRNMIAQEGLEYYGIDFSENMLKFAKEKADKLGIKVKISKSNAEKLTFDEEFFDFAIFISTLHCIGGETLRKKSLQELFRVLKRGGEVMLSVWNKDSNMDLSKLDTNEGLFDWQKDGVNLKRYYYFYDPDELEYLLKEVGFEIMNISVGGDEKHSKKNILFYLKKP